MTLADFEQPSARRLRRRNPSGGEVSEGAVEAPAENLGGASGGASETLPKK